MKKIVERVYEVSMWKLVGRIFRELEGEKKRNIKIRITCKDKKIGIRKGEAVGL